MSKSAWDAFHTAATVKLPFEEGGKAKQKSDRQTTLFLTADDFGPNIQGRKNIHRFVQAMKSDFDGLYYDLVVDGMVQLKDTHAKDFTPACWDELLARIPGYFQQKYSKGKADGMSYPVQV